MYRLPINNIALLENRPTINRSALFSAKIERTIDIVTTVPKLNITEP